MVFMGFQTFAWEINALWILSRYFYLLKFRTGWNLIFDPQPDSQPDPQPVPRIPHFKQLVMMNVYCFWDKVLFRQTCCENIFKKVPKNRKNQQKCENENSRETTKLVIIISNREHTLDVISKAFIFWSCWQKWGFRVRHVMRYFSRIFAEIIENFYF